MKTPRKCPHCRNSVKAIAPHDNDGPLFYHCKNCGKMWPAQTGVTVTKIKTAIGPGDIVVTNGGCTDGPLPL